MRPNGSATITANSRTTSANDPMYTTPTPTSTHNPTCSRNRHGARTVADATAAAANAPAVKPTSS